MVQSRALADDLRDTRVNTIKVLPRKMSGGFLVNLAIRLLLEHRSDHGGDFDDREQLNGARSGVGERGGFS